MTLIAQTRQRQILDAAATCFVRRGFHQSTMQEICREASLSPGSVYRYYSSKEEIIAALVEESCADFLSIIAAARSRADISQAFDNLIHAAMETIQDPALCILNIEGNTEALRNPRLAEIVLHRDAANLSALSEMIRHGQSKGIIDPDLDPNMSADMLVATMKGLAMQKSLNPKFDTMAYSPLLKTLTTRFLKMGTA